MDEKTIIENWKKNKSKENTIAVINLAKERIEYAVNKFRNSGVPESALRVEAKKLVLKQAESFNPGMGASFQTHASTALMKLKDFVEEERNTVRIPHYIRYQIPNYINEKDKLKDKLGREPTSEEMSESLKVDLRQIQRLETNINRKEISSASSGLSPVFDEITREQRILNNVYFDLQDPRDKLVFEHTFGYAGKQKMSVQQMASKLGVSEMTIRRSQKKIETEAKKFL